MARNDYVSVNYMAYETLLIGVIGYPCDNPRAVWFSLSRTRLSRAPVLPETRPGRLTADDVAQHYLRLGELGVTGAHGPGIEADGGLLVRCSGPAGGRLWSGIARGAMFAAGYAPPVALSAQSWPGDLAVRLAGGAMKHRIRTTNPALYYNPTLYYSDRSGGAEILRDRQVSPRGPHRAAAGREEEMAWER